MRLFDTHCHLDALPFDDTLMPSWAWILPAIDPQHWTRVQHTASTQPRVFAALGIHPHIAGGMTDAQLMHWLDELQRCIDLQVPVAIGEIGLDFLFHREPAQRQRQRVALEAQLAMACASGLPCILHCVKAYGAMLEMLRARPHTAPGVLHAYSGSVEMMRDFTACDMSFGFGGMVTWTEGRRAPEACKAVAAERLLLETDAPWQAPQRLRGQPNTPLALMDVLREVARLRGQSPEEIAALSWDNACRLFQVEDPSRAL